MLLQNPAGRIELQFLTSTCSIKKPRTRQGKQEQERMRLDMKLERYLVAPVAGGIPNYTSGLPPQ